MSRRGFWLGLLAGVVITVLLAAAVMFVMHVRWPSMANYGPRGPGFRVMPRGGFYPRTRGWGFGFGALLCGPLFLLAAAVVVGLFLGKRWHSRQQAGQVQSASQPPAAEPSVKAPEQPPVPPAQSEVKPEPPAEAGSGEVKS